MEYSSMVRNGTPEKFVADRIKQFSPSVFRTSLIGQPMAMLCGPEGNKFLFSNENTLVEMWWPSSIDKIFPKSSHKNSAKNDSAKARKIFQTCLKGEALQKNVCIIDAVVKDHLNTNWNHSELKVCPVVSKLTFTLACRLLLSIEDPEKIEKLLKPIQDIASGTISMAINLPGTAFNRAIKASRAIREELQGMMKQRKIDLLEKRASPTQDLLSLMLLATDENDQFMSELDISSHILGFLHAGYDTVNVALIFIVKYLAELPEVYQEVLREQMEIARSKEPGELLNWEDTRKMRYSWNVASEVLRMTPPVLGTFRQAITDFTYAGYKIPKGWKFHWMVQATHRNPEYFPNPEKFDPSRFEGSGPARYAYVPFGGGTHMCPGNEYARMAILVFMHNLVTKFRWEKLIPNEKVLCHPYPRPDQGLPIRLHPHKS
ncbi:unnamed protein product [Ilex paraguariensis]|uniref:Cytochrome P450 n=1 Tax=Ilex paraguariensis TaxID=185542 RepID=A0ABC8S388_9AQUA